VSVSSIDLTLVLSCYNEKLVIEESVAQIVEVLDQIRFVYESIFVDHCSKDRRRTLDDETVDRYPDERESRILHEHNKERGGAVADGVTVPTKVLSQEMCLIARGALPSGVWLAYGTWRD
jgi:glycosyltransferase involved in cell wall biosynthesis